MWSPHMPLFADEPFWKVPNVYDVGGAVGLLLAVFSIWLSWWLAKRDLRRQAARFADRIALGWLEAELSEALRCLREVHRTARERNWIVAAVRLDDAEYHVSRVVDHPRLTENDKETLRAVPVELHTIAAAIQRIGDQNKGLSDPRQRALTLLTGRLSEIANRLRHLITEA